ncbi:MAG TPA: ATP phosphoribosyltransferase regulatory subunit [Candidatus Limnocylindria bacterium]|nr:ATP phosphoribosyltransferase regulatory subunit [Candidatus Limnocylindria bacterium]
MTPAPRTSIAAPPRGFRDILPTEARELRAIERALTATFTSHGYVPLEPPMVERGAGDPMLAGERLIRFLDRDGGLLALRPDITTAVARLVAQRYGEADGALRLSYFAPVFREESAMLGEEREFDQAGIELVGASGALADAEALALLAESLAACGLSGASIEVGHVGVVTRLFADATEETRSDVLRALRAGDHVGALRIAREGGMSEAAVERARSALAARGRDIERIDIPGVDELREVIHLAREIFPGEPLWGVPNLALVPELPYYTGIVFEALHPASGFPIATGGRYDLLLEAFGASRPATGFAINIPRLHLSLFASGWRPAQERALVSLAPAADAALTARVARRLRAAGIAVAIGAVAEPAGLAIVAAEVLDEQRVRLHDGRVTDIDVLARELA